MSAEKNDLTKEELGSVTEGKDLSSEATTSGRKKKVKPMKVMGPDNYGMYYLGFENGGELPTKYKNCRYTGLREVQRVVDEYNQQLVEG